MLTGLQLGDKPAEKPAVAPAFMVPSPTGGQMVDPAKVEPPKSDDPKPNDGKPAGDKSDDARPDWLPEKFKTPADMAAAYAELEKKQSAPAPKPAATPEGGLDMNAIEQEWAKTKGQLSEATLKTLKDRGLTTDYVAKYVAGQQAEVAKTTAEFVQIAGGEEQLKAVLAWAPSGLSAEEAEAYQSAVDRGDAQTAKMLFEVMNARYVAANGQDPKLVTGPIVPGAKGLTPFESQAQVVAAMSDPKYKTDPAYRKKVYDRLAITP